MAGRGKEVVNEWRPRKRPEVIGDHFTRPFVSELTSPITLLVTEVRGLMHGEVTAAQLGWVFLSCAVLVGVFGPLTMRRYRVEN